MSAGAPLLPSGDSEKKHDCSAFIYVDQSEEGETVIRCSVCSRVLHRQLEEA